MMAYAVLYSILVSGCATNTQKLESINEKTSGNKAALTCENLPQLGIDIAVRDFQQQCQQFGIALNAEQIRNRFFAYDKQHSDKRQKMIEECKINCQEDKFCVEKSLKPLIQPLQKFKQKNLSTESGCKIMVDFLKHKSAVQEK